MLIEPFSHCHHCGHPLTRGEFPRTCTNTDHCKHAQYHNPTPIGVMLQTVTDGDRVGIVTPTRTHEPRPFWRHLLGGYQEASDTSAENAGNREGNEEVQVPMVDEDMLLPLGSRACGPLTPVGKRQILYFSVNPNPLHTSFFDNFEPDAETLRINFSWEPEILAFPTHTWALARYFQLYQQMEVPAQYLKQPRTGEIISINGEQRVIYNVPYAQPQLDCDQWAVELEEGGAPVYLLWCGDHWEAV